ncbi:MAG: sulfatase-like hydrolase/transferase [Eubacteriales bacterium]|nr:sulfatase-like hydrolase/transferase [Eubacteriales bacterium]
MLLVGSVVLAISAFYFSYLVLIRIVKVLDDALKIYSYGGSILFGLLAAVITVVLAQVMIEVKAFSMGIVNFMYGVLIVWTVILFLFCITGKIRPSIGIGVGLFMLISTVNVYVFKFRSHLFEPGDLFSASTVANVIENYSLFPVPYHVIIGWSILAVIMIVLYSLRCIDVSRLPIRKRLVLLVFCTVSCVAVFLYASDLKTYHWHKEGAKFDGYVLDFVTKFKEIFANEPDGYSTEFIAELADRCLQDEDALDVKKCPHIFVIVDEAFSDLSVLGDFSTDTEVIPFVSSLRKNAVSGYALVSVYGGNTANSEYEFLTGNSMAWLSPNAVPYQQYMHSSTYSMVSYLKSRYNYRCIAMHPFLSSGWDRPAAYSKLGFDKCYFVDDFPKENLVRKYVSDQEMIEFLIKEYESEKENPLFIFGVTMQNHGGYKYAGSNYTQSVSLVDYDEFPDVEQYLSLIHESDKAVQYLISYFENVDDDVVIVFFGDHQPKIDESFYEAVGAVQDDSLDERQKRYKVPFFIWANYEIEEEYIDCVSLNFLSTYVYDVAGISLPPYNQFLSEMETVIPAINANGFYSLVTSCYLDFDEADEVEAKWLNMYEILQYNCIFDEKNRNGVFFPVLR